MAYETNIQKSIHGFLTIRTKTKITSVKTKERILYYQLIDSQANL